jgi:hypothetical protein
VEFGAEKRRVGATHHNIGARIHGHFATEGAGMRALGNEEKTQHLVAPIYLGLCAGEKQ